MKTQFMGTASSYNSRWVTLSEQIFGWAICLQFDHSYRNPFTITATVNKILIILWFNGCLKRPVRGIQLHSQADTKLLTSCTKNSRVSWQEVPCEVQYAFTSYSIQSRSVTSMDRVGTHLDVWAQSLDKEFMPGQISTVLSFQRQVNPVPLQNSFRNWLMEPFMLKACLTRTWDEKYWWAQGETLPRALSPLPFPRLTVQTYFPW